MKTVCLLIIFAITLNVSALSIPGNIQERIDDFFREWKVTYDKNYLGAAEEFNARQNFEMSLKRVNKLNRRSKGGAIFGLNKFSDLSPEEFKEKYLMTNTIVSDGIHPDYHVPEDTVDVPLTIDWRTKNVVSAVKDQEQCGSCWAFSTVEAIESAWMIAKNIKNDTFAPLSPQQVVDCDRQDMGCNGGNPPTAYEYIMKAGGVDKEAAYPYKGVDGRCSFDKSKIGATLSGWKYATSTEDEDTLKANVAAKGPLSICVDAQNWQDYVGGVMTAWQCAWVNILDHCVQAVGYDMSGPKPYWLVRNSWGTSWGEGGYIRLEYGDNACGLTNEATFAQI